MQERQDAAVHVHHQCECPLTGRPERPWSKSVFMYLFFSELVVITEEICSNQQEINLPSGSFKSESANDSWVFSWFPWHQGDPNKSSSWQGGLSPILLVGNSHHHPNRWRRWPCWGHPKGRSCINHPFADFFFYHSFICFVLNTIRCVLLLLSRLTLT